jgi:hypothetical protein
MEEIKVKNFELNLIDNFFNMRDSMCYDSGTNILSADIELEDGKKYQIDIAAQGHVKVFWHGDMYKCASQMPEELIDKYYRGVIDEEEDYDCVENNWWEVMVYRDGHYIDWAGGVLDCDPCDFKDIDDVKEYLIDTICNDFDHD